MARDKTHQVGSHNRVQRLRLENHAGRHGIHQHLVDSDIRKVLGHLVGNLIPENHAIALRVALCDNSQELAGTLLGRLKGKTYKSGDAMACEDGDLGRRLPGAPSMGASTMASIFALAVFADDDPIKVTRLAISQRRLGALENLCGTDVGVLLEWLADG
jgi:hypothetical protein